MSNSKKWLRVKKDKQRPIPTNLVKFPYGAETLNKSHETTYGTRPQSEITQPEKIYDIPSTSNSDHSNSFPGREDTGVWPISVSGKRWTKNVLKK
jgi:hypothetical protein